MTGPFRLARHPGNWAPTLAFFLSPKISGKGVTLAVCTLLYCIAGSMHEERRLEQAYGDAYRQYKRDVPFILPKLR